MKFTEQHELIRKLARDFAEKELTNDVLDTMEETHVFPQEIRRKMAKAGFFGIKIPRELGGAGADNLSYVIVMEEIAKKSASASIYVSNPNSLSGGPLLLSGTEAQIGKYLKPIITGEKIMAFCMTEPGAGSDAGSMATTAVEDGDSYVLNGRKSFITMAPIADIAVIYAKTAPEKKSRGISAFIVELDSPGVSRGKPEEKMGLVGFPIGDIILENVRVPKENLLGELNRGFSNAMKTLEVGRMGVAAQSVGVAQAALDESIKYAKERKQFGKRIADFQAISFTLADMAAKVEAARGLVYETARLKDEGKSITKAASIAKYFASEMCNEVCAKALQIHGGYGYIKDYKIERFYRDCRVFTIYEGTSQVQQMIIAGQLLK